MRLRQIILSLAVSFSPTIVTAEFSDMCQERFAGKRLTVAVPNSPGGGYDTYARALAPALSANGGVNARVVNMPSGGGLAARSYVMNADPDELTVLIENTADLVTSTMGNVGRGALADKDFMIEGYEIVGIIHSEPSAWVGRAGLDVTQLTTDSLVASEGSVEEAILPLFIVGMAMGVQVDAVTGYDGTREMTAAILRGEADVASMSLTTALQRSQDEGLDVVLILSEGMFEGAANVPYLAGEGSATWLLTKDLPNEQVQERRLLANAVASLRGAARGMFVSAQMDASHRTCMAALMDIAIADPVFFEAAEAQGRMVAHQPASEAVAFVQELRQAHADVLPTLTAITKQYLGEQ